MSRRPPRYTTGIRGTVHNAAPRTIINGTEDRALFAYPGGPTVAMEHQDDGYHLVEVTTDQYGAPTKTHPVGVVLTHAEVGHAIASMMHPNKAQKHRKTSSVAQNRNMH